MRPAVKMIVRWPIFLFVFFVTIVSVGFSVGRFARFSDAFHTVCDLAKTKFYRADQSLDAWANECHLRAQQLNFLSNESKIIKQLQDLMALMQVSHFQVYDPRDDQKLWKSVELETGIRAHFIEDHLIIYRILPESSAERAGVNAGDEIVAIEGADQVTPWGASHRSGRYTLVRNDQSRTVAIVATELQEDMSPTLVRLGRARAGGGGVGLFRIPSFRSEFFSAENWRSKIPELQRFDRLIVDLRDNSGGNFVAMLRVLSFFKCAPTEIGEVVQSRRKDETHAQFEDDTADAEQINMLERVKHVILKTFPGYGCFSGQVTVLIDSDTSSVAEIFANGFLGSKSSRVWGQPTAGQVVLAVWYELKALGPGFSVSIPEAVFVTPGGLELEGRGVFPERELYYDLVAGRRGEDNWLSESLR